MVEKLYLPYSIALIIYLLTPTSAARFPCVMFFFVRSTFKLFFTEHQFLRFVHQPIK